MKKFKKKPKLCVFCGKDESAGPMNMEHFVPRCLWAGRRPKGTATVPSHVTCNSAFVEDNDYFRTVIAMDDAVQSHPQARELIDGPISRLMIRRTGQFLRMAPDFALRPKVTPNGLYFGYQPCFPIDYSIINRVLQNIVKGMFYSLGTARQ